MSSTAALNTTATKTTTTNQNQNKIPQAGPAIQTEVDNKPKIIRVQIDNKLPGKCNSNRCSLLTEN